MTPPMSLTDSQLELVKQAAALIPPHDRDQFLRSVANRLRSHPTDHDLQDAINLVLNGRGIAGGVKANWTVPETKRRLMKAQMNLARFDR